MGWLNRERIWLRMTCEAITIACRMLVSGDIDRFEREARAFRAKHGIGRERQ
jgi:hypothetical protein